MLRLVLLIHYKLILSLSSVSRKSILKVFQCKLELFFILLNLFFEPCVFVEFLDVILCLPEVSWDNPLGVDCELSVDMIVENLLPKRVSRTLIF